MKVVKDTPEGKRPLGPHPSAAIAKLLVIRDNESVQQMILLREKERVVPIDIWIERSFNISQQRAIVMSAKTDGMLIQGHPGTGNFPLHLQ